MLMCAIHATGTVPVLVDLILRHVPLKQSPHGDRKMEVKADFGAMSTDLSSLSLSVFVFLFLSFYLSLRFFFFLFLCLHLSLLPPCLPLSLNSSFSPFLSSFSTPLSVLPIDWARFPIMCLEKVQQAFLRKKRQTTFSGALFRADCE